MEEQSRVEADHQDHYEEPFSNPAWWRDFQMPQVLVRWALTVLVAMAFFEQVKKWQWSWSWQISVSVILYFIYYFKFKNKIVSTIVDGTRSAIFETYNAFKLPLSHLPEYRIWRNITRNFVLGLVLIEAPDFLMGILLVAIRVLIRIMLLLAT